MLYRVSQFLLHDPSDFRQPLWLHEILCLWISYLELKLNAFTQMANAYCSLLCIQTVIKCKVAICWWQYKLLTQLKDKPQNLSEGDWELINVLPLPMKAWTSTVVSTNCLKVSLLIVVIKILWMKLFVYIHRSQEANA